MAETALANPLQKFNFAVVIAAPIAQMRGGFSKVGGLSTEYNVTEYREGGQNRHVQTFPGLRKSDPVTLERGAMEDTDLWNMFALIADGNQAYKFPVTVSELHPVTGQPVKAWLLNNAWVQKYQLADHDATSNDVLMETITLQHDGFEPIPV